MCIGVLGFKLWQVQVANAIVTISVISSGSSTVCLKRLNINTCGQHQRESLWFLWLIPQSAYHIDGLNEKNHGNISKPWY